LLLNLEDDLLSARKCDQMIGTDLAGLEYKRVIWLGM
jgi:hypothetical protein